ncbi:ileal sodium/bile acid cotransporter-like [Glandiceps talaboti]
MASEQDMDIGIMDSTGDSAGDDSGGGGGGGGNATTKKLVIANQVVITTTLVILMIGMGCTMTLKDVLKTLKRPVGIIIGACCQFILMPFLGWSLAHIFELSDELALGTLAIATCPGGAYSNILTFWTDGDTCLSVCMTTCSTLIGIGMMPLNLFIYSRSWAKAAAVIPYVDIVIALTVILFPCAFGMLLRWKVPKVANVVAKVGSVIAFIGILSILGIVAAINPAAYTSSWRPYVIAISYPLVAYGLGYVIPYCFRQSNAKCRTIAFETGVQNTALALTIINLLLARGIQANVLEMLIIPSLHGTTVVLEFAVLALAYRFYVRRKKEKETQDEKVKEKTELEKKIEDWAWSPEGMIDREMSKFAYDNPGLGENSISRGSSLDRENEYMDDVSWPAGEWDQPTPYGTYPSKPEKEEHTWKSAIKYANAVDRKKGKVINEQGVQTDARQQRLYDVEVDPDGMYTHTSLGLEGWRGTNNGLRKISEDTDESSGFDDESRGSRSTVGDRTPKPIRFTIRDKPVPNETEV